MKNAIIDATKMLVAFRKIIKQNPGLNSYSANYLKLVINRLSFIDNNDIRFKSHIKEAYNLLVVFRRIREDHPKWSAPNPEQIESVYKNLWLKCLDEEPPFKV